MSKHIDSIFELSDFRPIIIAWAEKKGRGEYRKMADAIGMHTTLLSQVMSLKKCLTEEQAITLCDYMQLNRLESDFFLKLIQRERAGSHKLKSFFEGHLQSIRFQSKQVKNHIPESAAMNEQDMALFYSSWQYCLVRLATDIEKFQTAEAISKHFELPLTRVNEILLFLKAKKLCEEKPKGYFRRTVKNTHIQPESSLSIRHHQNWRARSISLHERLNRDDLSFTAPISISSTDRDKIRNLLLETISQISKIVETSQPEEVVYLGIDWIKI